MTRTTTKRVPPATVSLPLLNIALEPFHGSFYGTKLIIEAFDSTLVRAEARVNPAKNGKEMCSRWQHLLERHRDPDSRSFRDPESLQVAQVLARYNGVDVCQEMANTIDLWNPGAVVEIAQRGASNYKVGLVHYIDLP